MSEIRYDFDSGDEHSSQPMSHDEKRNLTLKINKLPGRCLSKMVKIIEAGERIAHFNAEEVELDFETLKPVTLRELEAYVKACPVNDGKERVGGRKKGSKNVASVNHIRKRLSATRLSPQNSMDLSAQLVKKDNIIERLKKEKEALVEATARHNAELAPLTKVLNEKCERAAKLSAKLAEK